MRFLIKGSDTYDSLLVNHKTQLGWHPPLDWTTEDAIVEEVFEKNGEKLPVGFFVSAIEMGRELHSSTLERTRNDISTELQTMEVLLLSCVDAAEDKKFDYMKYKERLVHYLQVVESAMKKTSSTSPGYGNVAVDPAAIAFDEVQEGVVQNSFDTILQYHTVVHLRESFNNGVTTTIVVPHAHDVLLGRSATAVKHIGNVNWKILVATNKSLHSTLSRRQKTLLSRSIVMAVKNQSPPGRFLQKDPNTNTWSEVGMQRAIEKTAQALRDVQTPLAPTHRHVAQHTTPRRPRPVIVGPDGKLYRNNTGSARVV